MEQNITKTEVNNEEEEALPEEDAEEQEAEYYYSDDENNVFEYRFAEMIGKGSQSSVYSVINRRTGEKAAAKVYRYAMLQRRTLDNDEPPLVSVANEIKLMAEIQHPYIIPLTEVIDDQVAGQLVILMPFAKYGDLQSYVDDHKPSEKALSVFFYQIADAVKFIHSRNIVHRDLKPENILVFSEERVMLSDFSVSTVLEPPDVMLSESKGPPAYLSPEELNGEDYYPKPADVWAFGVALYKCLFGYFPFNIDKGKGQSEASTFVIVTNLVNSEELVIPENKFDQNAIEIIKSALQKDPSKRPTFEEIVLNPWFDHVRELDKKIKEEFEEEKKKKSENENKNENENQNDNENEN
ncbi:Calcium/calmodulin-dependent protein kinase type 1 [Tritrichomonas foetus]|uniref:Calcium/calmodulin-dependent protein kinase type 1 n=1 Tax=Tritrichomonas foetus TaxID=1144522 RepID=A0A1J4KTZ2_9EUKA|nr:Calcium/calmodulin-dependent protein kinase type 1 [Tritrichomonas foetus]|eukprot:OHT14610.1 Calcium/calmodulin-dependent protein kinase type 1 [Tritrichomonas foetus]